MSVKTDCGGEEKYKTVWKVALMWPKEEKKKKSNRGGGCLHLITEQCPSYEQMYSTLPLDTGTTANVTEVAAYCTLYGDACLRHTASARLFRSLGFAPNVWHGETTNRRIAVPGLFSKSAHGQRGWAGQGGITIMRVFAIKADASLARVSRRPPSLLAV